MGRKPIWFLLILIFVILPLSSSEDESVKLSLVQFMQKLSTGNSPGNDNWGWTTGSDPCNGTWTGVACNKSKVRWIVLENMNLTGTFDASSLCTEKSLAVLSLKGNSIGGLIPEEIGNCKRLTHLYLAGNKMSGALPSSLSQLNNLKRLDLSDNDFIGELPNLSKISGLLSFFAQNNNLSGELPGFDFSNLRQFNVSNNSLSGPIPDVKNKFFADSFSGNPGLCGDPLPNACPPSPPPPETKHKHSSRDRFLIYSGYILLGLVVVLLIALKLLWKKKKQKQENTDVVAQKEGSADTSSKPSRSSSETKGGEKRSEYSLTSVENGNGSSSLVVLQSPVSKGLRFEDLLRAPAELLGRGKHGSLYKVLLDDGAILAVKRIKDWDISSDDFRRRMLRIDQIRHPRVLPPVAFYCSNQEKLLVYEYHPNGSLFKLLHGSHNGQAFDWGSRLNVAAAIAETLAFMHNELREDGIAHGNLKSTNILFNKTMEPCISEYGLMVTENQDQSFLAQTDSFKDKVLSGSRVYSTFKVDVYAYGVILLELLTGKLVLDNGVDLARWVHSVVKEEWTVEVFDRALISEGANEERMLNLLQVALKCIHPSPNERPSVNQIAAITNSIKEEEERSTSSEPLLGMD